jgi:hypothetical protein
MIVLNGMDERQCSKVFWPLLAHSTILWSYFTHRHNVCGFEFLRKAAMGLRITDADDKDKEERPINLNGCRLPLLSNPALWKFLFGSKVSLIHEQCNF